LEVLGNLRAEVLDEKKAVPDILGELDALVVHLVDRTVYVEEPISQSISDRHGDNPQHGVDCRGEVLPTEGDDCEDCPDEHANDGHENHSEQLCARKRDETKHHRNSLLENLDEDTASCEGCIQRNRQHASDEGSGLKEAGEKHEHERQLHERAEIG
jgi:hypothetical protein